MFEASPHSVSRRELLIFLYKYRKRLVMAFFVPFVLAVLVSAVPSAYYKAETVLIVRLGSEYVYQPEGSGAQSGPPPVIPFAQDQIFKSEVAILSSDDLHKQVIETIGINKLYPELDHPVGLSAFIRTVRGGITAGLQAIGLAAQEPLTQEAFQRKRMARAIDRFDKHFDIVLQKESAVINVTYQHKDDLMAMQALDTLLKLYLEKRQQLYFESRSDRAQADLQAKREQVQATAKAFEAFKRDHRIYAFDVQRAELLKQRGEAQALASTINSSALQEKIGGYNQQLDQLDAQERKMHELQNEAQVAEIAYNTAMQKLDAASSYDELQHQRAGSVRVIQPPTVPAEPKKWQMLIILGGFFVSILCMLLMAAYTEFSRKGFLTPEQIERSLSLPVLAVIPLYKPTGSLR